MYFKAANAKIPISFLIFATIAWLGLFFHLSRVPRDIATLFFLLGVLTLFPTVFRLLVLDHLSYFSRKPTPLGVLGLSSFALVISLVSVGAFPVLLLWHLVAEPIVDKCFHGIEEDFKTQEALRNDGK